MPPSDTSPTPTELHVLFCVYFFKSGYAIHYGKNNFLNQGQLINSAR